MAYTFSVSFAMIARYEFCSTPPYKEMAERFVPSQFWEQINNLQHTEYIALEGLQIYYSTLDIKVREKISIWLGKSVICLRLQVTVVQESIGT